MSINLPTQLKKYDSLFYREGLVNRDVPLAEVFEEIPNVLSYLSFRYNEVYRGKAIGTRKIVGLLFCESVSDKRLLDYYQACYVAVIKFHTESADYIKKLPKSISYKDEDKFEFLRSQFQEMVIFLEDFENAIKPGSTDYGFGRRNLLNSSEVYYSTIYHMFNQFDQKTMAGISTRPISIFLIRQSVELRIKNALGVYLVRNKHTHESIPVHSETYIDFIYGKSQVILLPIERSVLRTVIKWSNQYIHTGYTPELFKTWYAMKLVEPLFKGLNNEVDGYHRDGAIVIKKEYLDNLLESELLDFVAARLPKNSNLAVADIYLVKIDNEALVR